VCSLGWQARLLALHPTDVGQLAGSRGGGGAAASSPSVLLRSMMMCSKENLVLSARTARTHARTVLGLVWKGWEEQEQGRLLSAEVHAWQTMDMGDGRRACMVEG
jgi:hypothetical protein